MNGKQAIEWFAAHGQPAYINRVTELNARAADVREQGQQYFDNYGTYSVMMKPTLQKIRDEIAEIEQAALDRYDDLASDPLD